MWKNYLNHDNLKWELLVLFGYAFSVVLICRPMPWNMGSSTIGGAFLFPTLWSFEFISHNILENGAVPFFTKLINFPEGGSVTFIGWAYIPAVLMGKITGLSVTAWVNFNILLFLWMGCYFTYRFALLLTENRMASFFGGLAFGTSPYVISLVYNGQIEKLSTFLFPVIAIAIWKVINFRKIWIVILGIAFAILVSTSPYNGILGAILALAIGIPSIITKNSKVAFSRLAYLMTAALVCLLFTLPFLFYWTKSQPRDGMEPLFLPANQLQLPNNKTETGQLNNAGIYGWFFIDKWVDKEAGVEITPIIHVHKLGWIVILLSLAALILSWKTVAEKSKTAFQKFYSIPFLLYLILVFFIIASGYSLALGPLENSFMGYAIPMPLYWLYLVFPKIGSFSMPYRAASMVMLFASVLAAMGLTGILKRTSRKKGILIGIVAILLLLFEFNVIQLYRNPLPVSKKKIPKVYFDLSKMENRGPVLDVPNESHGFYPGINGPYIFFQTIHKHPVVIQLNYGPLHPIEKDGFHLSLKRAIHNSIDDKIPGSLQDYSVDFKYLVLHKKWLTDEQVERVGVFLNQKLELIMDYKDDGIVLYTIKSQGQDSQGNDKDPEYFTNPHLHGDCP